MCKGCYTHLEPKVSGRKFAVSGSKSSVSGNCHVYKNEKLAKNRCFRWIFGKNWPHESVLTSMPPSNLKNERIDYSTNVENLFKTVFGIGGDKNGNRI